MSALDSLLTGSTAERGEGRPKKGYYAADGGRVVATTTPISRFKDSGGMIQAANNEGLAGRTLEEAWYGSTGIGHEVHKMVEAQLHGLPVPPPSTLQARASYESWLDWWEGSRLTVEATEIPLVSEEHRFGGTIDAILRDSKGRLCVGDWKTSNAIYADHLIQVAAYGILWNECAAEKLSGGFHIVRFSKEHGDLEHRHFTELDDAHALFLLYRAAYDLDKSVKKRAR